MIIEKSQIGITAEEQEYLYFLVESYQKFRVNPENQLKKRELEFFVVTLQNYLDGRLRPYHDLSKQRYYDTFKQENLVNSISHYLKVLVKKGWVTYPVDKHKRLELNEFFSKFTRDNYKNIRFEVNIEFNLVEDGHQSVQQGAESPESAGGAVAYSSDV